MIPVMRARLAIGQKNKFIVTDAVVNHGGLVVRSSHSWNGRLTREFAPACNLCRAHSSARSRSDQSCLHGETVAADDTAR